METWKPIPGYEGLYEVSDSGKVRSLTRTVKTNIRHNQSRVLPGHDLKPHMKKMGYYSVDLCKEGKVHETFIHRIVADAFIPNPQNAKVVNHKNGIKTDNRANNLEWVSYRENHWHARKTSLLKDIGQHNNKIVLCVETGEVYKNSVEAAKWLIDSGNQHIRKSNPKYIAVCIRAAVTGKAPRAYGYHWKDVNERSTTIPQGSTGKRPEMGGPSEQEGEDIV